MHQVPLSGSQSTAVADCISGPVLSVCPSNTGRLQSPCHSVERLIYAASIPRIEQNSVFTGRIQTLELRIRGCYLPETAILTGSRTEPGFMNYAITGWHRPTSQWGMVCTQPCYFFCSRSEQHGITQDQSVPQKSSQRKPGLTTLRNGSIRLIMNLLLS